VHSLLNGAAPTGGAPACIHRAAAPGCADKDVKSAGLGVRWECAGRRTRATQFLEEQKVPRGHAFLEGVLGQVRRFVWWRCIQPQRMYNNEQGKGANPSRGGTKWAALRN
jgi:hypothetical protein